MGRVLLSLAHTPRGPQARIKGLGIGEHVIAKRQSLIAAGIIRDAGHEAEILDITPHRINELGPWDLTCEFHHNANKDASQNYCVVGYWRSTKWGDLAARCIAEELEDVVPWHSYGAQPNSWFRPDRIVWFVGTAVHSPAVLSEAGFFSCTRPKKGLPSSAEWYSDPMNVHAEGRAKGRGIVRYLEERHGKLSS